MLVYIYIYIYLSLWTGPQKCWYSEALPSNNLSPLSVIALLDQKNFRNQIDVCLHSGNDPAAAADMVDGNIPSADGEEVLGLSTDSLSRLRSPSVMEVREKGYEKLKEELAKAQRVRL